MRSTEERFWAKVDKTGDCWLWTGATVKGIYGRFRVNEDTFALAHRFAYELAVGPIPEGMDIDHRATCSKRCVRPDHLRPATRKQNLENLAGPYRTSKSGVRGVTWHKRRQRWDARVRHNGKQISVGRFKTIEEAEAAVVAKRIELFTHNDADREAV